MSAWVAAREARLTFGTALAIGPLVGLSLALWASAPSREQNAHLGLAAQWLELIVPMALALAAARTLARDMVRGSLEYVAVRRMAYAAHVALRTLGLTLAWAAATLPVVATMESDARGALLLASAGSSAVLCALALAIGALMRSELAGAVTAALWWLGSLAFGSVLPDSLPASALHLAAYSAGFERWMDAKLLQLTVAVAIVAIVLGTAPALVRRAVIAQSS